MTAPSNQQPAGPVIQKRRALVIAAVATALVLVATLLVVQQRVRRLRVLHPAGGERRVNPPAQIPPVEQWTATFGQLSGEDLAGLLGQIEVKHPDQYRQWSLGYLHARALVASNEREEAARRLEPFLAEGHPFRDRALFHRATIADDGEEGSRYRSLLIFNHPDSIYREEAIDEEIAHLASEGSGPLEAFALRIESSASTARRREITARLVEALAPDQPGDALRRTLTLLQGGTGDDAADRAARALDRPEILAKLTTEQLALFGETFQKHRHYDRAIVYLRRALGQKYADDLQFALGRSYFGAEQFAEAQEVYLRGASATAQPEQQATFFWHAARCAQLQGDDAAGEKLMTSAIAVKGKFPATTAALTQRLRTRLKQRRFAEAASDLALLKRIAGKERPILDGSLAYAAGMLGAGNSKVALAALDAVPRSLLNDYDKAEFAYWRARALEQSDPHASFESYLEVLRSEAPSHFAYFARRRLDAPAMASRIARELSVREVQVKKLLDEKKVELAKRIQTDRILLSSSDRERQLQTLAAIYRQLPEYREVLELKPAPLPQLPGVDLEDPQSLLMAMGLHDEATSAIEKRWGLRPAASALTRSYALNLGGASRDSIYAIEVMMRSVPKDYHPALLPETVQHLLYPRYFFDFITEDAKRFDADPILVLSIMREESRFNPRAKSQAAARGLLQFIITTARDIGRDVGLVDLTPEDLYDPRVIIRLGARYVSNLAGDFGGNRYRVAAAYNAGPRQVILWNRMQPAEGDDYFLTAVNFDETKHYVRKVMNSWERYRSIYGEDLPAPGGLRAEP